MKEFKILDLFCGTGGFSCGLDQINGFETKVALDFDKNAITTFKKNFPNAKAIYGDICNDDVKNEVIKASKQFGVNMIVGGPPCQGFSLKGKKLGLDDPRNFLFLEYVDIVKKIKPEVFIIENVKNMITSSKGYFISQIYDKFTSLGYTLNHGILNAYDFGVPQSRERAIIIGTLNPNGIKLPQPRGDKKTTVRDAISDLAYLNSGEGKDSASYIYQPQSFYQEILRNNSEVLRNHKATNHSQITLAKLSLIPPEGDKSFLPKEMHGNQKFMTTWSRLVWDKPSPTIDTRFDTPSNGRNSHPILNRAITPREAARIQSFPDTFIFYGPKTSICRQIGNAVPPLLAKGIGEHIKETYNIKGTKMMELYNDDAYKIIKEFQKKGIKVDHIITDPPYNISKDNNFVTMKNPRKGVDFGDWDRGKFDLYSWIPKYANILNKNGSMIIFCSYRYISYLIDVLESKQANMVVKDILIWQKSNPMPRNIKRRYVQDMEFAIWAVKKNSKWVFNKPDGVPYLRSIFTSGVVFGKERLGHPTQKSLKVMDSIIKIHTNPGDTIIDPFMGSASIGEAAINNNRNFIGVEYDKNYYKIAKKRLEKFVAIE
ncbi:DNA (cytosine-5-)-methyltransferase [Mesomycoplasma ovipneumoniae]|uniref:DNA (cytosine-5-)-methyltransferase n=1 Tax=Mesomycoplasma ovipneumoniae TaxID=29562 RepID=UPI00083E9442|nr:DNA (cytosine-5-)-methyltransferase [Mesomycoplasma ovipneumoniae]